MQYKKIKKLALKKAIICHAKSSIYRMNAKTADCYAFSYCDNKGKKDFEGGWDWSSDLVDENADFIYKFSDGCFYRIVR